MKNLINIQSILAFSIGLTGTLILASSCSEKTVDSKEVAENENVDKLTADDQTIVVIDNDSGVKFLMDAAEMQLEEISLGKLAQKKGTASDVKELGKMMEADHTQSFTEISALAQSKAVSIPTSVTEDSKDVYTKLEEKTGNDFDKTYSEMMVEHHEDAIDLFEKASTDSEDPAIKTWANSKLPGLKTHLDHAKACKEKRKDAL
ncbi:DUF4142 domain-containing protein [Algoriphagus aestuariicola]|uniref:DUF4142 domain-containing protein n=1 Tax=Algoriphagus aestuariicola TaxID=1852016 RepID=A0ABS3BJK4_9BACT|nr:DUF4142 domain-containing protein [Algoriphagus aestuariicola]MBN7799480.1 DUF4142 domain-containing protein [Algoriphagus aestuariicola]